MPNLYTGGGMRVSVWRGICSKHLVLHDKGTKLQDSLIHKYFGPVRKEHPDSKWESLLGCHDIPINQVPNIFFLPVITSLNSVRPYGRLQVPTMCIISLGEVGGYFPIPQGGTNPTFHPQYI